MIVHIIGGGSTFFLGRHGFLKKKKQQNQKQKKKQKKQKNKKNKKNKKQKKTKKNKKKERKKKGNIDKRKGRKQLQLVVRLKCGRLDCFGIKLVGSYSCFIWW